MRLWPVLAFFFIAAFIAGRIVLTDYGPDEPYHLAYIDTLVRSRRLPYPPEDHLVQHPPGYYLLMAPVWAAFRVPERPLLKQKDGTYAPPSMAQMQRMAPAGRDARAVLRALQALFGLGTLLLVAATLGLLGVPRAWKTLLVGLLAAWPVFIYISGVVNNENASILFSALACYAVVYQLKRSYEIPVRGDTTGLAGFGGPAFKLGLLLGAGALVKQTTLFSLPLGLYALSAGPARPGWPRRTVMALCGAAAGGMWWPLYNLWAHGQLFPAYHRPGDQFAQNWLLGLQQLPDCITTILESSFVPDWSWHFLPHSVCATAVIALLGAAIAALAWNMFCGAANPDKAAGGANGHGDDTAQRDRLFRRDARVVCLCAAFLLLLGILQYTYFKDRLAQVGGRYWLNAFPYLVAFFGASLPPHEIMSAGRSRLWLAGAATLGLLVLFDCGYWLIAADYYGALLQSMP